jgi:DNA-binding NarL/FixJ family response regulator
MKNPTVVLADDEQGIRQMEAVILAHEKVDVVGEAGDGEEALRLCRRLKPSLLLADLRLPKVDAVGVMLRLREDGLPIAVMIYTGCGDDRMLAAVLDAKPAVLVHKADPLADFRMGVRYALGGRSFLSPWPTRVQAAAKAQKGDEVLTHAEKELVRLLAKGSSNKQAADILGRSESTVGNRRSEIMRKLGVHELAGLVHAAAKLGLVEL